ncbi:hypothetical protein TNCV_4277231, partial [Trichonephila clavipes]
MMMRCSVAYLEMYCYTEDCLSKDGSDVSIPLKIWIIVLMAFGVRLEKCFMQYFKIGVETASLKRSVVKFGCQPPNDNNILRIHKGLCVYVPPLPADLLDFRHRMGSRCLQEVPPDYTEKI